MGLCRVCLLLGLLEAVSIITVNSLYLQVCLFFFFFKQIMEQVDQKFNFSRKQRDFEGISLLTSVSLSIC